MCYRSYKTKKKLYSLNIDTYNLISNNVNFFYINRNHILSYNKSPRFCFINVEFVFLQIYL